MSQPKEHIAIINELMLAKSLLDWRKNPDMSLRRIIRINCSKHFVPNQSVDTEQILQLAVTSSMSNLLRQTFVSNYEYLRNNIDDKMTNKLKILRNTSSSNTSNVNTTKFMDAIRQSLVHNDIEADIPNWRLNDKFNIEINFKDNHFEFNLLQIHQIMNEFLALKKEPVFIQFYVQERDLFKAVNKNKLSPENINKYILLHDKDNIPIDFDKYQCDALYNLLNKPASNITTKEHLNIIANNNYFILQRLLPCKHNAGHISYINNMTFRCLMWLKNNFINREKFIDQAYKFETKVDLTDEITPAEIRCSLLEFINYDSIAMESALISNALFTLFSISPQNKLQKHFNNIDTRRLRNSLMHGRYYYNHANGFEFYDGRNNSNLEHIGSLELNDILHSVSNFINDYLTNQSDELSK